MHYVVAGTGYAGRRALQALPGASGISRSKRPGLSDRRILLRDLDAESIAPIDISAPYSLLYTIPPPEGGDSDPRLARLLAALKHVPARIVYIGTSGVYGDQAGGWVHEDSETKPALSRARRRWDAEKQLVAWSGDKGCQLTILRVPAIYGPYRIGLQRIRRGVPIIQLSESGPGNRIHVDDLVTCCVLALDEDNPPGIYNVGDGDHRSNSWFALKVASMAGLPPQPQVSMDQALREFDKRRLSFLRESRRLDTTRIRERLGFAPKYADAESGILASLVEEGLEVVSQG